jgi:diguanylate cyclase (GGDEF)-like protein/PAS domain S-box-containing protein
MEGEGIRERETQLGQMLSAEKRVLEMIALGKPTPDVLDVLLRAIERQSADGMLCSVLLLEGDARRLRHGAAPSLPAAYCAALEGLEIGPRAGSCGTAAYTGEQVVVADIETDPLWTDYRSLALEHGLRACWSVPVKSRAGKVLGTFAMYYREPRAPKAADFDLIARAASLAGIVLERDRTDVALDTAEARLRMVLDSLPLAIAYVDREGRYRMANVGLETLLERPREELIGRTVREVLDEETYARLQPHIAATLAGGESTFERERPDQGGGTRWLHIHHVPDRSAGAVLGYFALITDITDRKRAEAKMRDSEARFRALTTLSSDWYWEMDAELRFTYVSEGFRRVRGVDPALLVGKRRWELDVQPIGASMDEHRAVLEAHQPFQNFVYARRRPDGKLTYVSHSGEPVHDAGGRFAGYRGVARDITAAMDAEQALRESEERFRSLSKLSSDFYWETDAAHRFKPIAGGEGIKAGVGAGSFGKTAWEIPSVHPSAEGWAAHQAMMEGHLPFRDFEFAREAADGSVRWYSVSGEPVFDAAGDFTGYRGVGRDISERKRAERDLERLAHFDKLTGLPNRAMLQDRLAQALLRARRSETLVAVLFLDLDRFKEVNDSLGHAAGDELLHGVAKRIAGCLRGTDTVARLGGDEFTVVLEGVHNVQEIEHIARKILAAVALPLRVGSHDLFVSTSIGVTVFPLDDQDQQTLLKNADMAMYHAKQEGRNNVQFFAPEMGAHTERRMDLSTRLRHAVERGELCAHYQPLVEVASGRLVGLEALLRWENPEVGKVSPAQFIPIAEDTGLIVPIGAWMLHAVCRQMRAWRRAGCAPGYVAVNLSPRQFRQQDLVDTVQRALREYRMPPDSLELEITESTVMQRTEEAIMKMRRLRQLGVRIAIDDFGTGYSSLAYLQRFPVHTLKIDQSFVRDIRSDRDRAAIVATVIGLAKNLKLTALAEGVETRAQLDFLKAKGCELYQGYFFGRPVAAAEIEPLLKKQAARRRPAARRRRPRSGPSQS